MAKKKKKDNSAFKDLYSKLLGSITSDYEANIASNSSNQLTNAYNNLSATTTIGGTGGGNNQSFPASLQGLGSAIGIGGQQNVPGNLYTPYQPYNPNTIPGIPWNVQTQPIPPYEPLITNTSNNCVDCFKKDDSIVVSLFIFHGNSLCKDCYRKQLKSSNQLTRILEEKLETGR